MRIKPWVQMPAKWVRDGRMAELFSWSKKETVMGSTAIAALQLWVAMVTQADVFSDDNDKPFLEVNLTYNALMESTGLSRQLVSLGVSALLETELITSEKLGRNSRYFLYGLEPGDWCKLPAKALYKNKVIMPFQFFQKRSKYELYAMKLFLYYAAGRDTFTEYTMASFEKLNDYTGVPEKDIPRTNAFLLTSSLLANIAKEKSSNHKLNEPNKYYLTGYKGLSIGMNKENGKILS